MLFLKRVWHVFIAHKDLTREIWCHNTILRQEKTNLFNYILLPLNIMKLYNELFHNNTIEVSFIFISVLNITIQWFIPSSIPNIFFNKIPINNKNKIKILLYIIILHIIKFSKTI